MSGLYEALKDQIEQEKGAALATVVRGPDNIGSKLLVFPNKTTRGTLGLPTLDALALIDAVQAMWKGEALTHVYTLASTDEQQEPYQVFIEGFPPTIADYCWCWSYRDSTHNLRQNA